MIWVFSIIFYVSTWLHFTSARLIINWMYEHEDLSAGIITGIILAIAIIVAMRTLYAIRHDRSTTIALNLRRDYDSGVVFEGRTLINKICTELSKQGIKDEDRPAVFDSNLKYYELNYNNEFMKLVSVPALFDMMGWMVRNGCCKATAIDEQLPWEKHYALWETYIRHSQEKGDGQLLDETPTAAYGNFVWLYRELKKNASKCKKT